MRLHSAIGIVAVVLAALLAAQVKGGEKKESAIKVVMLGDSVTLSFAAPDGQKMPQYVEKTLNTEFQGKMTWTVVNAGAAGETAERGGKRLKALLDKESPRFLVISYGLNDCRYKDAAKVKKDFADLLAVAETHPAKPDIFLLTASPFVDAKHSFGKDAFFVAQGGLDVFLDRQINQSMRMLAVEKNLPLCDVHRAFLREKDWAAWILNDGVHPTPEGNRFMGETVGRALAAYARVVVAKSSEAKKKEKDARADATKARKLADSDSKKKAEQAMETANKALATCPYLAEAALAAAEAAIKAETK